MTFLLPIYTLWQRELVRFYRQKSRIIGVIGSPLLFWILIGSGLGTSFKVPGAKQTEGYLEFFFPGTILLVVLFTSIFAAISIIEDRKEGFLQSVLVSPASRSSIVLGKIFGITSLAMLQAMFFIPLAPFAGISLSISSVLMTGLILFLASFGLAALGFLFAWKVDSTQGFHAVMNLLFIPMWILSGALFPPSGASVWLGWIMKLNPLSYALDALRYVMYWDNEARRAGLLDFNLSMLVSVVFGVVMFVLCVGVARKK